MRIFLSHSHRDKALVREIRKQLPEHITSWIDEKALIWTVNIEAEIRNAIQEEVDFVVIFLGRDAIKSDWVKKELQWALERERKLDRKFVLPILLDDVWDRVEPKEFKERLYLQCLDQEEPTVIALADKLKEQLFAWLSTNMPRARQLDSDKLFPRDITERDFLKNIDLEESWEIYVLAHTGRRIFNALYDKIEDYEKERKKAKNISEKDLNLQIRVLVRNPYAENQDRYGQVYDTVRKVKNLRKRLDVEIRFYQALPTFRGIVCVNTETRERKNLLSTYEWLPGFDSHAFDRVFRIDDSVSGDGQHPLVEMVMTWFKHYWGAEEIHTVVFDFDDTIAKTMEIQTDAWVTAIQKFIDSDERTRFLEPGIANALDDPGMLKRIVKRIFLEKQMAPEIFKTIFPNFPKDRSNLKEEINHFRFESREELTLKKTELFSNVENVLERLHHKYQLAIVSSTSEYMIEQILKQNRLSEYFSVILGKHGPKSKWENIFDKATLLIKLSNLTGIPLSRTVFIGDNNSDFKSAKQLNIEFIEARMVANAEKDHLSKNSLIDYETDDEIRFFNSYEDPTLEIHLEEINKKLVKAKFRLDPKFLP